MRKALLLIIVMISAAFFSTTIFAAAWNVPNNVRIVQKSNTDANGRIYGTIQSAINSITNASATNPYLVKVMPGIYDLGTGSIQMKEYVDVEGSGPENTVITSANSNSVINDCAIGTVVMANNTSIRNVKVVNRAPDLGGDGLVVAALVFNDVEAKAEGVSVFTGSDTAPGGRNIGICTSGDSAHANLNHVNVESHNYQGDSEALAHMGGKITLANSKAHAFQTSGDSVHVINNHGTPDMGTVIVTNSTLEGTSAGYVYGIQADRQFVAYVSNTVIALHGGVQNYPFNGFWPGLYMENVKITTDSAIGYGTVGTDEIIRISASLLPGDTSGLAGAKLVNCYDENYNPIPNQ